MLGHSEYRYPAEITGALVATALGLRLCPKKHTLLDESGEVVGKLGTRYTFWLKDGVGMPVNQITGWFR